MGRFAHAKRANGYASVYMRDVGRQRVRERERERTRKRDDLRVSTIE